MGVRPEIADSAADSLLNTLGHLLIDYSRRNMHSQLQALFLELRLLEFELGRLIYIAVRRWVQFQMATG